MKISKTNQRDDGGNRVSLVRKEAKLTGLLTDPAEQEYVDKRMGEEKSVFSFLQSLSKY